MRHQQCDDGADGGVGGVTLTCGGVILDGLLEHGDVLEGAEEQHHLVVLVSDRSHLHVEPHRAS